MIDWNDFVNIILKLILLERFHFSSVVLKRNLPSKSQKTQSEMENMFRSQLCGTG